MVFVCFCEVSHLEIFYPGNLICLSWSVENKYQQINLLLQREQGYPGLQHLVILTSHCT